MKHPIAVAVTLSLAFIGTASAEECVRQNPLLDIQPLSGQGVAGTTLAFFTTLVNNDTGDCSSREFVMAAEQPPGFISIFDQDNLTLAPGTSFVQNYYSTSPIDAVPDTYAIRVIATDQTGAVSQDIRYIVIEPPPACSVQPPTLAVTPENNSGHAGQTLNYTISVTNEDSPSCSGTHFDFSGSFASDFSAMLGSANVALNPGETAEINLAVTSTMGVTPGSYPFTVSTQDPNHPERSLSDDASYTVLGPPVPVIPKPVITDVSVSCSTVRLSWTVPEGAPEGLRYHVFVDRLRVLTTNRLMATLKIKPLGYHRIRVLAKDGRGNRSEYSDAVKVRIRKCK